MSKLILSLDGGGIRGAATTQFLSHIEEELAHQNSSHFATTSISMRARVRVALSPWLSLQQISP